MSATTHTPTIENYINTPKGSIETSKLAPTTPMQKNTEGQAKQQLNAVLSSTIHPPVEEIKPNTKSRIGTQPRRSKRIMEQAPIVVCNECEEMITVCAANGPYQDLCVSCNNRYARETKEGLARFRVFYDSIFDPPSEDETSN